MFVCRRFGPVPIETIFDTHGDESNESDEGEYCEESDRPQSPTKQESWKEGTDIDEIDGRRNMENLRIDEG